MTITTGPAFTTLPFRPPAAQSLPHLGKFSSAATTTLATSISIRLKKYSNNLGGVEEQEEGGVGARTSSGSPSSTERGT